MSLEVDFVSGRPIRLGREEGQHVGVEVDPAGGQRETQLAGRRRTAMRRWRGHKLEGETCGSRSAAGDRCNTVLFRSKSQEAMRDHAPARPTSACEKVVPLLTRRPLPWRPQQLQSRSRFLRTPLAS